MNKYQTDTLKSSISKGIVTCLTAAGLLIALSPAVNADESGLSWAGCGISKKAFMTEMAAAFEKKTGIKIDLKGGGATRGIREVADGSRDIGGSCRNILVQDADTERAHTAERRLNLDPVAWDPLVAIVHKNNPVNNITIDQIRQIYTGKITNWDQLGGNSAAIELYVRGGKISGVGRTLRELVFANYEQEFTPRAHVVKSSGPLEKAVEGDVVNGIGITGYSSAKKRKVKVLTLNGKAPTYENLTSGDYPMFRPLYLVTHQRNTNPNVIKFKEFILSEDGRAIMRKAGTVPYGDGIDFWMRYLAIVRKAQETGLN